MTLHLVGMGLGSVNYLTKGALEAAARSDKIYLDTYTSPIDESLLNHLRREFGEKLIEADRSLLEEGASRIVEEAGEGDVCVLVPGDPLIATTHLTLILEAARRGIGFRIVHGVSAHTALISSSLLQAYKFGRTVTIPRSGVGVETCYRANGARSPHPHPPRHGRRGIKNTGSPQDARGSRGEARPRINHRR